jgi:enoyl-CoA hydratase/carnithine racemase
VANRLAPEDLAVLVEHIAAVNATEQVLVLRVRGQGKYFCSGYDIGKIGAGGRSVSFEAMVDAFEDARPVTIAALHGGVYGGGTDLALSCDFRIGARGVDMFMPAARLGLHFYQRGLERYVARLGLDTAKKLFLTAQRIDADEMRACGFLTDLVAPEALDEAVERLSGQLAAMAPIALLGMKKHLNRIARGTLDVDDLNRDIVRARDSEDIREGAKAWAEKRVPRFTGR